MKYTCPSCGYFVFSDLPGSDAICPICFWEDDISQLRFASTTGSNRVSLVDAQKNYAQFGAIEENALSNVRKPNSNDQLDPYWRPLDATVDKIEVPVSDKDYGLSYPTDRTELYYWK